MKSEEGREKREENGGRAQAVTDDEAMAAFSQMRFRVGARRDPALRRRRRLALYNMFTLLFMTLAFALVGFAASAAQHWETIFD